ncbi:putative spermine spermidine synthase family protein [Golovinomyces cichoracearum]|uniref:Putative spermine spermidine synthase family protein n=1 Tax=Golovinomyces cichoracearum TaxID=62708 RepID=A0A420J6K6_9PEZI|nr:putative spermine spermidine synthase family protein [Golovinomyces cichoracearum]
MARQEASSRPKSSDNASCTDPLFTQKNFERELENLAAKAQGKTWIGWAIRQVWILLQVVALYSLAATSSNISILSLSPVYGTFPSTIWHKEGIWVSCFLGWSLNRLFQRYLAVNPRYLLPLVAAYIPMMTFFLIRLSSLLGAGYGPLVTKALTLYPLLVLTIAVAANLLDEIDLKWRWIPSWISDSLPGIFSFLCFQTMELFTEGELRKSIGTSFFKTRLGIQIALAGIYSVLAPSKLLICILPAVLHTALFNIHVQSSHATDLLSSSLVNSGWTLLERKESITGYISVIESHEKEFRALRCDHSLLGGEWLMTANTQQVAEPIYSVFVMLEAVRLVDVIDPVLDSEAKAYVIGLGVGTTPAAFMKHGIHTTIVEIDPVVYDFANKYFNLPKNHIAVIADAVNHTAELVQKKQKYDYIVHDVFTGGAEPVELFTFEFIQDLNSILKPGGVIAINYAGDLKLPATRIVVQTIRSVFPTCRIFRESEAPSESLNSADAVRDFTNLVIFCTNGASKVKFREPKETDFLGSGARQRFLVPQFEVNDSVFNEQESDGGLLRKNDTERFRVWQQKSALGHWYLMRTVLPPMIWEMW